MSEWMGPDRRKNAGDDHDLLLNINSNFSNFIETYAGRDAQLRELIKDHEDRIRFMERAFWIGLGALGFLQIIIAFLKH